jgi:hypothetical protein
MERPFGTPGHSRVENIKNDLQETGWHTLVWTYLTQDRGMLQALANMVELWV